MQILSALHWVLDRTTAPPSFGNLQENLVLVSQTRDVVQTAQSEGAKRRAPLQTCRVDRPQMCDRKTANYSLSQHKAAIDSWGTRGDLSPPILCNHTADVRKPRANYEVIRLNLIRRALICIDLFLQTSRSAGTWQIPGRQGHPKNPVWFVFGRTAQSMQ